MNSLPNGELNKSKKTIFGTNMKKFMKFFIFTCVSSKAPVNMDNNRIFLSGGILKIGQLADAINLSLSDQYDRLSTSQHINTTKINGYKKMGLIIPEVKKKKNKAYFDFKECHLNLILEAYKKITFQGMRTREAFNEAKEEICSPSLF